MGLARSTSSERHFCGTILVKLWLYIGFWIIQPEGLSMSTVAVRLQENAPGKYFVTSACNGCGICFSFALQNFMYSNDSSYYYVFQQPGDPREVEDLLRAMEVCPMNCIKDDGEPF